MTVSVFSFLAAQQHACTPCTPVQLGD